MRVAKVTLPFKPNICREEDRALKELKQDKAIVIQ